MITAIPMVGGNIQEQRIIVMLFETNASVDVKEAVKQAAEAYCKTEKGEETFTTNCNSFAWEDIIEIPDEIFAKFGLKRIFVDNVLPTENLDEQIVIEDNIIGDCTLAHLYNMSDIDAIDYLIDTLLTDKSDIEKAEKLRILNQDTTIGDGSVIATDEETKYYHDIFWELMSKFGIEKTEDGRACVPGRYDPVGI